MDILITYDVSRRHTELKQELLDAGFMDKWVKDNITYYLPNTTLWCNNLNSPEEANRLFHKIVNRLNENQLTTNKIVVQRFMAVVFGGWLGIPGTPHA